MPGCVTKVGEIAHLPSASPVEPVGQPRQSLCEAAPPSEIAYCGLHASERRSLKRSLETAEAKAMSLGGSVVASHSQVGTCHPLIHTILSGEPLAQFFSAKPTSCSLPSHSIPLKSSTATNKNCRAVLTNSSASSFLSITNYYLLYAKSALRCFIQSLGKRPYSAPSSNFRWSGFREHHGSPRE